MAFDFSTFSFIFSFVEEVFSNSGFRYLALLFLGLFGVLWLLMFVTLPLRGVLSRVRISSGKDSWSF